MAKIYDQKNQPGRQFRSGQQEEAKRSAMVLFIGIILAILIVFMLYRIASGHDLDLTGMVANNPVVSSFYVTDR